MPQNKLTTPILKSKLKDHKTLKSKLLKLINEAPFPLDQSNNNTYLKKGHNHSFYKHDWNDSLNKNRPWYKFAGEKITFTDGIYMGEILREFIILIFLKTLNKEELNL